MLKLKSLELSSLNEHTFTSRNVAKLDISHNLLTDMEGIGTCAEHLKWLNASHNQIQSVKHLKTCTSLNVLNLGYNKISSTKHFNKLKELNALILNNNEIQNLDGLSNLKELNTLVVSSNHLETVDLTPLKKLQKLSASNNKFTEFPALQAQKDLKDMKLNNNSIETVPDWLASSCIRIKVLDLGNNKLKDFDAIENLQKLPYLENLNLKGNLLCDLVDYHIKMKELFPNLKLLDFKKMSELYFKAVELRSKASSASVGLDGDKSKTSPTKLHSDDTPKTGNVDLDNGVSKDDENTDTIPTSKAAATCIKNSTNTIVNRGFKSTKLKLVTVTNVASEVDNNDGCKKSVKKGLKSKKQKGKKHLKEKVEKCDLEKVPEKDPNVIDVIQQKKKKKKRKLSDDNQLNSENTDDVNREIKKKKKKRKLANNDNSELNVDNEDNTDDIKGEIKKRTKKSVQSKVKMKSGIVAIKKVAKKRSKSFDLNILCNDSISFGMGGDGWK